MIKTILIIILALTTIEVSAQNRFIGITGGASRTDVTSNIFKDADLNIGASGGITYERFLKKSLSIEVGLLYQQRGFRLNIDTPNSERASFKYHYNYISVPMKVGFTDLNTENNKLGFVKVGLIPALLVKAKTTTPTFDDNANITGTQTIDVTYITSIFDVAGLIEAGGGSKITDRLWLTLSVMYQHSLTSITNAEYFGNNNKIRHNGVTLQAGLNWALKKE